MSSTRAMATRTAVAAPTPARALQVRPPVATPARLGAGEHLPDDVRSYFEPRFGADFSGVRLHRDAAGANATDALHAEAFTVGQHIALGPGRFAPSTVAGRQLLGHELAHVVQQGRGGAAPDGHAGSAVEQDARQAGEAAATGAATIPVKAASGVGISRQEKSDDPERVNRNVGLANELYTSFLSSPLVPDKAKSAVKGSNDWLKQQATKLGITDEQRHQVVSSIVDAVGPKTVAAAQTIVVPPSAPPQKAASPPPAAKPVAAPAPKPRASPPAAAPTQADVPSLDLGAAAFGPQKADPSQVHWVGNPATQPSWTKGMRLWTDEKGNKNLYSPETGLSTWNRDGKQVNLAAPEDAKAQRIMRSVLELSRTGGKRYAEGKGWLDDAGWQAHLRERRAALAPEAKRRIDILEDGTKEWAKTQGGAAALASAPSHLLGGRSRGDPARFVAEARQNLEIGLHEIDKAQTPDELAEAEDFVRFAQSFGEQQFSSYREDVYTGGERTITGIKAAPIVVAVGGTAFVSGPLIATYGGVGVTLKVAAGGAAVGAGLSAARQGAQFLDHSRTEWSGTEIGQGALFGAAMPFVPGLAPTMIGKGVESAGDEFAQGHNWTGALDTASVATPFAIKGAPAAAKFVKPRIAAIGMRVAVGLSEAPALTGEPGGSIVLSDVAPNSGSVAARGPAPQAPSGGNYITIQVSPEIVPQYGSRPVVVRPTGPAVSPALPMVSASALGAAWASRAPSTAPNADLIRAAEAANAQLRAAKASPAGIQNADLNGAERAIRELQLRQRTAPDPAVQRALEAASAEYNRIVHKDTRLTHDEGSAPQTSAAQAATDAAGVINLDKPGVVGAQSHNTSPQTRRALGTSGATHQSAHLVPQAVDRAIGSSAGRALTANLLTALHRTIDGDWVPRWKAAVASGREITGGDVQRWVGEAIDKVPPSMLPAETRGTLGWMLTLELEGLGLGPDTVIVPARP